LSTVDDRTPDEHALLLSQLLDLDGMDVAEVVTGVAVTSSVPRVTTALRQMAARWFDVPCVVLEPGVRSGMPILYDNPKEVGADRIANAIGAYDLYGGPCIVVDLGTATTFDAISSAGEYLGGAIAPGIAISMDALFHHAAALRRVELVEPRSVIGKSTVESIQSGAMYGFAAQVDGMCRRIIDELGHSAVVATGGLSDVIAPLSACIEHREPWLTLHGLRLVYERNAKPV
jgi:type III pantothenate kinase